MSRELCVFAKSLRALSLITSCFVNCEKMMTIIHVIPVFPHIYNFPNVPNVGELRGCVHINVSYLQFSKRWWSCRRCQLRAHFDFLRGISVLLAFGTLITQFETRLVMGKK